MYCKSFHFHHFQITPWYVGERWACGRLCWDSVNSQTTNPGLVAPEGVCRNLLPQRNWDTQPLLLSLQTVWVPICLLPVAFGLSHSVLSAIHPSGMLAYSQSPLLIHPPKSRLSAHLCSFVPIFSYLWNCLCESLQSHPFLQGFKLAVHCHTIW